MPPRSYRGELLAAHYLKDETVQFRKVTSVWVFASPLGILRIEENFEPRSSIGPNSWNVGGRDNETLGIKRIDSCPQPKHTSHVFAARLNVDLRT